MSDLDHVLESRAHALASRLSARRDALLDALAPPGTRPPFTKQFSKPEALAWWQQHVEDDLGKKVLANMDPASVMELRLALRQQGTGEMFGGVQDGIY